ncbi:hypothetical protein Tco_0874204 [Tanacetum coccineum]|uniref:Uncharacterized protein n=1 Tax=Tanacetum coccineum TaxID=301880 RepID=A0ABQ5BPL8_9ASTR
MLARDRGQCQAIHLNAGKSHGMCRRASREASSKWRFRKISMNYKAKRSSFSADILLEALFPLSPRFNFPPPKLEFEVPSYETPLLETYPRFLVLFPTILIVGLVVVLHEENPVVWFEFAIGGENADNYDTSGTTSGNKTLLNRFHGSGSGTEQEMLLLVEK